MGRQIHFHMLPEDQNVFLRMVSQAGPVVALAGDGPKTEDVRPVPLSEIAPDRCQVLYLWNRELLPNLKEEWMVKAPRFHNIGHTPLPLLEFSPSFKSEWEGKPALIRGRLYGVFDADLNKPPEFEKWYERLVRWIRKNYKPHPSRTIGGYVGPAAYEFYEMGGFLLPSFRPPRTDAWVAELCKQHPIRNFR